MGICPLPVGMGEVLLVVTGGGVVDFNGVEIIAIDSLEIFLSVVGDENLDAVELGLFQWEHSVKCDGGLKAPLSDLEPFGEKHIAFEGKNELELFRLGQDIEVVDVDHGAALSDEDFDVAVGMVPRRPVLHQVFTRIELIEGGSDVFKVVDEDSEIDVAVPRDHTAVAIGAHAGAAIDPPGDLGSI